MTGFVIRVVFWLGLVLVMLPGEDGVATADHALRRLHEADDAAGLVALCRRQPDICAALAGIAGNRPGSPSQ